MPDFCVDLNDVREARVRIAEFVRTTPVFSFPELDELAGASVSFKCENLQHIGAFKARGAMNAVLGLSDADAKRGVVTHSSGNHAAAVARAGLLRGCDVHIVMPSNATENKLATIRKMGIEPVLSDPTPSARMAAVEAIMKETNGTLIHPFDDPGTIAGQGTAALEMVEQMEAPDAVVVPVGGGGLLSGTLTVLKSLWPETLVIAAEPAWADDAYRGWKSGRLEQPIRFDSVGDGLRSSLGQLTFPIIHELVDDILLVDEEEIVSETKRMVESTRMMVEPSGAVSFAAVVKHRDRFQGKRIAVLISGGNLDLNHLPWKADAS